MSCREKTQAMMIPHLQYNKLPLDVYKKLQEEHEKTKSTFIEATLTKGPAGAFSDLLHSTVLVLVDEKGHIV